MALPTGLIPVLVFVLTAGIAILVTLGAISFHRIENASFGSALRIAFLVAGGLYVIGVILIWFIAGGVSLWEVPAVLIAAGIIALIVLMILPLVIGQHLIQRVRDADSETSLRFATYGWPIAMLIVFGIFVAPGGVAHGHLFHLGGNRVCLVGFCGIAVSLVAAVILEFVVGVLGPGIIGLVIHFFSGNERGQLPNP
jgi:hypothetical protein